MSLPLGRVGRVVSEKNASLYVKIAEGKGSTGGFLIWTADNPQFSQGYDNWVENQSELEEFFQAMGWQVEWE